MRQFYDNGTIYGRMQLNPWGVVISAAFITFLLVGFSQVLVVAAWSAINHMPFEQVALLGDDILKNHPEVVLLALSASQVGGFGLAAVLLSLGAGKLNAELSLAKPLPVMYALLALLALAAAIPAWHNISFSEKTFILPDALKGIEQWATESERSAEKIINAIVGGNLWVNLLVVALIPAICEELFFRGFLQNQLQRVLPPQAAVWVTGFVFSVIHFQAYGFFVRWGLGVALGYLRLWSGSLLPSIAGHFANNATIVFVAYLAAQGVLPAEINSSDYRFPLWVGISATAIAGFLFVLLYVRRKAAAGIAAVPSVT